MQTLEIVHQPKILHESESPAENLKMLKGQDIFSRLKDLVASERKLTAQIIEYIREVDRRRLYLDIGHTSLFSFLTKEYGYSPAAAQRRIDAARLSKENPRILEDIRAGELNLTQVSLVAQGLRDKKKLAASLPQNVEMAKNLLEGDSDRLNTSRQTVSTLIDELKRQPTCDVRTIQMTIAKTLDIPVKKFEKSVAQQDGSVRFEITFTKDQLARLDQVKETASHSLPNPTMAELINFLAEKFLKKKAGAIQNDDEILCEKVVDKNVRVAKPIVMSVRQGATSPAEGTAHKFGPPSKIAPVSKDPGTRGRALVSVDHRRKGYISARVRREIFTRDKCCQWPVGASTRSSSAQVSGSLSVAKEKQVAKICGSKFQLQIDHKKSKWLGGGDDESNLQLLCGVHNRLKYSKERGVLGIRSRR